MDVKIILIVNNLFIVFVKRIIIEKQKKTNQINRKNSLSTANLTNFLTTVMFYRLCVVLRLPYIFILYFWSYLSTIRQFF